MGAKQPPNTKCKPSRPRVSRHTATWFGKMDGQTGLWPGVTFCWFLRTLVPIRRVQTWTGTGLKAAAVQVRHIVHAVGRCQRSTLATDHEPATGKVSDAEPRPESAMCLQFLYLVRWVGF